LNVSIASAATITPPPPFARAMSANVSAAGLAVPLATWSPAAYVTVSPVRVSVASIQTTFPPTDRALPPLSVSNVSIHSPPIW
jgi:hypothetical protein